MAEPEFTPHPIADVLAKLLEEGGVGEEPVLLKDEAARVLEEIIDAYAKDSTQELFHVAATIYSTADWLEARNAGTAAERMVLMLDRPHVLASMQAVNERIRNEAGVVENGTPGDDFAAFREVKTHRRAPEIGTPAPEDSIKAGLLFPRRM